MKILITLIALLAISCNVSDRNYDSLPQCIKDQIDNPDIAIIKVGESKDEFDGKKLYWLFEEESSFGSVMDENCERTPCYGWCGLTTKGELDAIFDREWILLWE